MPPYNSSVCNADHFTRRCCAVTAHNSAAATATTTEGFGVGVVASSDADGVPQPLDAHELVVTADAQAAEGSVDAGVVAVAVAPNWGSRNSDHFSEAVELLGGGGWLHEVCGRPKGKGRGGGILTFWPPYRLDR